MIVEFNKQEEQQIILKVINNISLVSIFENIEKKICEKILEAYTHDFEFFKKKIKENYEDIFKFLSNNNSLIQNIRIIHEEIIVDKKINAEEYAIDFFKQKGFEIVSRFKNPYINFNQLPSEINDFARDVNHYYGRPDLFAANYNSDLFFLIEVKTNDDGLREQQVRWIEKHPHVIVIIFYLQQKKSKTI